MPSALPAGSLTVASTVTVKSVLTAKQRSWRQRHRRSSARSRCRPARPSRPRLSRTVGRRQRRAVHRLGECHASRPSSDRRRSRRLRARPTRRWARTTSRIWTVTPVAVPVLPAASRALALRFSVPPVGQRRAERDRERLGPRRRRRRDGRFSDAATRAGRGEADLAHADGVGRLDRDRQRRPRIDLGTRSGRDDANDRRDRVSHGDRARDDTARVAGRIEGLGAQVQRAGCGARWHRQRRSWHRRLRPAARFAAFRRP